MSSFKEHCRECQEKLGEPFEHVHKWLDEFASSGKYPDAIMHRIERHHHDGIEEVKMMWGDKAAKAAEIHIHRDCGRIFTKDFIRKLYSMRKKTYKKQPPK